MGKRKIIDEEFEQEYSEATRRGETSMQTEPRARAAHYPFVAAAAGVDVARFESRLANLWF